MSHAARQDALYRSIWAADPNYGTALSDVRDTVHHRIVPHMRRVYRDHNFTIVDFGAGDGRFLAELAGLIGPWTLMAGVDLYKPGVLPRGIRWFQQSLWQPLECTFDYGISTDTLEHMPPDMVPAVLANIRAFTSHGFLRISNRQDIYGTERGLHLHETVEPTEWWLARLAEAQFELHSWRIYPGHATEVWY